MYPQLIGNTSSSALSKPKPAPRRNYDLSPLDPSDVSIPPKEKRPWYMQPDGTAVPTHCPVDPETGRRRARLLPDEAPGEDRVQDQLMYFPPK